MTATCFVDTNVLVHSRDANEPEKRRRSSDWLDLLWRQRLGRVSFQVSPPGEDLAQYTR
jgi:hypothetical protein